MLSSVVVVSYRPGVWLEPCLRSVRDQADQLVVVDNGSAGGTAGEVGARLGATVVRSRRNLGFAGGADLGLRAAGGELVALLNDDAEAGAGWLAQAAAVLADPTVAAVGPRVVLAGRFAEIRLDEPRLDAPGDPRRLGRQLRSVTVDGVDVLDRLVGAGVHPLEVEGGPPSGPGVPGRRWRWTVPDASWFAPTDRDDADIEVDGEPVTARSVGRLVNSLGCFLRADGYAGDVGLETPDPGPGGGPAERFGLSGVALAATAATWRLVGPLARPLFAYYEDVDWSWRARRLGLRLVSDPAAEVVHHRSATSGGVVDTRVRFLAERNRLWCLARHAPRPVAAAALRRRLHEGPGYGVRRAALAGLPWALATRRLLAGRDRVGPGELWDRWAGVDAPVPGG